MHTKFPDYWVPCWLQRLLPFYLWILKYLFIVKILFIELQNKEVVTQSMFILHIIFFTLIFK